MKSDIGQEQKPASEIFIVRYYIQYFCNLYSTCDPQPLITTSADQHHMKAKEIFLQMWDTPQICRKI